ncbi:MAG: DUF998 domain-containing protein [Halobacteriaceae archaeon]
MINKLRTSTKRYIGASAGLLLILLSSTILIVSYLANPWFSLTHHALSDLGRRSAQLSLLYDSGLLLSGLLLILFLSQAFYYYDAMLSRVGLVLFGITGIGLLFIGYRANGISISDLLALLLAGIGGSGFIVFGIAMIRRGSRYGPYFVLFALFGLLAAFIAILVFDGLAIAELIAIIGYQSMILILVLQMLDISVPRLIFSNSEST